ncbi:MAG: hypothetical protein Q4E55_09640, partial [Bacteroidales bacterium]|nr:hypothetical protein [Bacteroidales bacterium]
MLLTCLIAAAFIGGIVVGVLINEIMDWAKDVFNSLSNMVKKAWVYIRRIPGGIKKMIRYIKYGEVVETSEVVTVSWEEVVRMHEDGEIDDDTFNALKARQDKKIAELNR